MDSRRQKGPGHLPHTGLTALLITLWVFTRGLPSAGLAAGLRAGWQRLRSQRSRSWPGQRAQAAGGPFTHRPRRG